MIETLLRLNFPENLNDTGNPVVKKTLASFWHFGMDVLENGGILVIERPNEKKNKRIEFRDPDAFRTYWNDNCPRKSYEYSA
ncbi:hypothetical protein [Thalassospira povalilytica]|uniref:hypothetical protein n=1 Tax=Thalassospira povalilytica TaxID=732237 RepID=UPI001D197EE0|nr:hypothetical protein [Thalassospira povalilytica]MCC4241107.1 hypothetical protein [Thalassospira povalilytica]